MKMVLYEMVGCVGYTQAAGGEAEEGPGIIGALIVEVICYLCF